MAFLTLLCQCFSECRSDHLSSLPFIFSLLNAVQLGELHHLAIDSALLFALWQTKKKIITGWILFAGMAVRKNFTG